MAIKPDTISRITEATPTFLGFNEVSAVLATALLATIIAIWAIFSQRRISAQQVTLEYLRHWNSDRDIIEARREFNRLAKEPDGLAKWAKDEHLNSNEARYVRLVLNEHEVIAIAIHQGILSDVFYRRYYRSGVLSTWDQAAPYVLQRRSLSKQPLLYHEFEELARWYRRNPPPPRRWFWWRLFP